ncbi:MAG: GAF domain-containing protein [Anaerolineales bacterium]|nr:GAF domain-containing protein [Anaerolineales bacterium]
MKDKFKSIFRGQKPEAAEQSDEQASAAFTASPAAADAGGESGHEAQASADQARLAALYRVSRVLGTSLDLDEVLNQVMDAVIGLTGAERGLLVLIGSDSKDWALRVARNFDQENLSNWEAEISRTIINTAVDTHQGVVTGDAQSDARFSQQASVIFNVLRSIMCAPLLARGRVIGAIYVDSRIQKGIFDEGDLEMLDALATQAAFAIDNARLYTNTVQKVKQLTIELDEARKASQVAEITETEYFRQLQARAQELRKRPSGS